MPNNVTNEITFYGKPEDIQHVRALIKGHDGDEECRSAIDFDRLIPMPESLNIEAGSTTRDAISLYLTMSNPDMPYHDRKTIDCKRLKAILTQLSEGVTFTSTCRATLSEDEIKQISTYKSVDDLMKLGETAVDNLMKYGAVSWYEWRWAHWGTKWNAYEQVDSDGDTIQFDTAWSMPEPILRKLAEICNEHNVQFNGQWINEDWRNDSGAFVMSDGSLMVYRDMTEEDARERCKDLWNYDPVEDENDEENYEEDN